MKNKQIKYGIYALLFIYIVYQAISTIIASSLTYYDLEFLIEGLLRTIYISAVAITIGTFFGIIFGYLKSNAGFFSNIILSGFLDILRSVPLIIQFILFYSVMGILEIDISIFWVGAIVLSAYTSAFVTEVVRAGIDSVPETTRRASRSLGLSYWQDYRYIVFPLGIRTVFPSWISIVLSVIKDSALVSVIGYLELLKTTEELISKTQEALLLLIGVGFFYFIISYPISLYAAHLERKLKI
ncbi:amino acid ABC transporter permease [Poseidonibacter lekithochrous]|uniref:amino acid ABC transporter permease n=1 Tax=Poseidonibacter lekithochrous TaxID=1904463 RepID=UPI000D36E286|nr:amino acid ABC transporter permease [Poseidonibacter lekithochrous]